MDNDILIKAVWRDGELWIYTDTGLEPVGLFAHDFVDTPVWSMTKAGFPGKQVMIGKE